MADAFTWFDDVWRKGLAPDPQMTVSEWAERHRMLPQTAAEPGRWRTSRTPYIREPMDCLSPSSPIEKVVVMAAAQVSKTECGLNFLGSIIHLWPGLCLHVSPTTEAARRLVRTRVDPMIESTPELASRVVKPGPRKAGNSAFFKSYAGGAVAFVGANSGVGLRSTPAKFIILDEVDGFPFDAGGEGDPVALAVARTATFRGRRKVLMLSTPTVEGSSRIADAYSESDQRKLYWPCLHCGEFFTPTWEDVRWPEGEPLKAHMVCPSCGGIHEERDKTKMLAASEWRATAKGDGTTAGFHIPGTVSPFVRWGELARDFLAAKASPERLQVWVNTSLGLPFEDRDTAPVEIETLMARAVEADPPWTDLLPDGAAIITVGADVQSDRIEAEFVAWGVGERSWSIDYAVLWGDTSRDEVWQAFDRLLSRRFRHPRTVGDLPVHAAAIDAGFRTDRVLSFTQTRAARRIWAIKGRAGSGIKPWPARPPKPRRGGVSPVHIVGVDAVKQTVMTRLRMTEPGPGHIAFPSDRDREWYMQLTSERLVRKYQAGRPRLEWIADRTIRNEALDARVYATAALHGLYASGLSLADTAARIAAAPLRAGEVIAADPAKAMPRIIRSRWLG
jgi:phage terminase large subunit GpA-like protein